MNITHDDDAVWIHRVLDPEPAEAGPLHGLRLAVKDNIDVAGLPTTAGARRPLYTPQQDAAVSPFLAGIAAPLGLGTVRLQDGLTVTGSVCGPWGLEGAQDITASGGWIEHLAADGPSPEKA